MAEKIISKEDIKKLALLSNLDVSGGSVDKLSNLLSDTLNYVKTLEELDTSKTEETFQVTGLTNVFQKENEKSEALTKEKALANAKETLNGLFSTKAVFER